MKYVFLFLMASLIFACNSSTEEDNKAAVDTNEQEETKTDKPQKNKIKSILTQEEVIVSDSFRFALVNKLNVREKPDTKSRVLFQVAEGYAMFQTGKLSKEKTTITIRGQEKTDAWYEVKLKDESITGWVHGALIGKSKDDFFPSFDKEIEKNIKLKKYKERVFATVYSGNGDRTNLKEIKFDEESGEWDYWEFGEIDESYHVFTDADKPVLIVTSPFSQSGDWFQYIEYFYNGEGELRAYHFHESSFNSDCGEARTDSWLYIDEDGKKSNSLQQETSFAGKIYQGYACFGKQDTDIIYSNRISASAMLKSLKLDSFF